MKILCGLDTECACPVPSPKIQWERRGYGSRARSGSTRRTASGRPLDVPSGPDLRVEFSS